MSSPTPVGAAPERPSEKTVAMENDAARQDSYSSGSPTQENSGFVEETQKRPWHRRLVDSAKTPGSAVQIVIAAVAAIAIGMIVTTQVDSVPKAVVPVLSIPGDLWLRALKAVVLPLIMTAMILAMVRLKAMTGGGATLAKWTVGYYVVTTLIAIVHTCILVSLGWRRLMVEVRGDALAMDEEQQALADERSEHEPHTVVVTLFRSFVTDNIFRSLAETELLAILIVSCIIGYLIDPRGKIIAAVEEVEKIVTRVITFLIKIAPIGVFFLILPNLLRLNIADIGQNLGVLIGASLAGMALHLFVIIPIIFIIIVRENPWAMWAKCSPAWLTAWGTASSAATLPVTIREAMARGIPPTVTKFSIPLGCLINMDGTAIYFPICVVFLAQTQGIELNPTQYVIIVLLATMASIGTTPIPSSSLVLTVMIANSVQVPITGMYAVIVAIDWFIDRFRTAVNVSCDIYAAKIVLKITGITGEEMDKESNSEEELTQEHYTPAPQVDNTHRV
ncbi:hypothetical protein MCOR25_007770 [Pyricularia grisea]|uniref:Amino acid transporter n=1 Tax=Pyricularia grisea TaxID=148305 RepID=A0A6P8BKV5_PYRGI|nr:uncharacterized protein PgNI_02094 [Pyricularia grisea]KAI6357072.1 hypothetical protein MCOR25_007770 [Pyricularia grisea]TLD17511.1 hypothetical protein PgNI_02094 [Pyricularia grisea]